MEAADKHIRLKPPGNVQNTLVGTAADEDLLSRFFHQQILLVAEILRDPDAVFFRRHSGGIRRRQRDGQQGDAFPQPGFSIGKAQPGISLQQRIDADVFSFCVVPGRKGMAAEKNRGMVIDIQKADKTVSVVMVGMGQHRQFHCLQIHTHFFRVVRKGSGFSRVKQKSPVPGFDVQAQAVLRRQVTAARGVFDQRYNFHSYFPLQGSPPYRNKRSILRDGSPAPLSLFYQGGGKKSISLLTLT